MCIENQNQIINNVNEEAGNSDIKYLLKLLSYLNNTL